MSKKFNSFQPHSGCSARILQPFAGTPIPLAREGTGEDRGGRRGVGRTRLLMRRGRHSFYKKVACGHCDCIVLSEQGGEAEVRGGGVGEGGDRPHEGGGFPVALSPRFYFAYFVYRCSFLRVSACLMSVAEVHCALTLSASRKLARFVVLFGSLERTPCCQSPPHLPTSTTASIGRRPWVPFLANVCPQLPSRS